MISETAIKRSSDTIAAKSLARLWPHRMHESSFLKNMLCHVGLHRWAQLALQRLLPGRTKVRFCRWCSKIEVNGVIYEP